MCRIGEYVHEGLEDVWNKVCTRTFGCKVCRYVHGKVRRYVHGGLEGM